MVDAETLGTTSLFEAIYGERWTLLVFDGGRRSVGQAVAEAAERLADWSQVVIRPVLATPRIDGGVVPPGSLLDIDRFAHEAYRLDHPTFVLVRPDGYVGYRGQVTDAAALGDYCRRHLTRGAASDRFQGVGERIGRSGLDAYGTAASPIGVGALDPEQAVTQLVVSGRLDGRSRRRAEQNRNHANHPPPEGDHVASKTILRA